MYNVKKKALNTYSPLKETFKGMFHVWMESDEHIIGINVVFLRLLHLGFMGGFTRCFWFICIWDSRAIEPLCCWGLVSDQRVCSWDKECYAISGSLVGTASSFVYKAGIWVHNYGNRITFTFGRFWITIWICGQ